MATESPTHVEGLGLQDKSIDRVHTALSNQNSRTFQGQVLIFQGLRITEVQGSAILTHISIDRVCTSLSNQNSRTFFKDKF